MCRQCHVGPPYGEPAIHKIRDKKCSVIIIIRPLVHSTLQ